MKNTIILSAVIALTALFAGCPGSVTLEEGGAYSSALIYQGDGLALAYADSCDKLIAWAERNPIEVQRSQTVKLLVQEAMEAVDNKPELDEPLVAYRTFVRAWEAAGTPEDGLEEFEAKLALLRSITSTITNLLIAQALEEANNE